ncbi:MAG: DUF4129 domain-containing protein [Acidobacteriota bacterium]
MKRGFAILFVAFALTAVATAASRLLNYENRVVRAAEQVARMKADPEYGEEGVSYIKKLLPKSEEIGVEDGVVTVDNTWLHQALDGYEKETDASQRQAKLDETEAWLRELDEHLRRSQSPPASEVRSSEAREKLRGILAQPEFQQEQETRIGKVVKEIRQKITAFLGEIYSAFGRLIERLFGASARSGWVSTVLIVVLLMAAVYGLVRMARAIRPGKRRARKRRVLGEEIAEGTTSRDLADAALASARGGDFRAGIRSLYISLLYELNERGLIELDESATNHEYLAKVSNMVSVAAPMRYLTDRFDYFWYGKFPSSEEEFAACFARYEEAIGQARVLAQSA